MKFFAAVAIIGTILTIIISILEAIAAQQFRWVVFWSIILTLWLLGLFIFIYWYDVVEK